MKLTKTEEKIINSLIDLTKEGGISKENLAKDNNQTLGALDQSIKILNTKIKDNKLNEFIDIRKDNNILKIYIKSRGKVEKK
jgi:ribosomal protein S18